MKDEQRINSDSDPNTRQSAQWDILFMFENSAVEGVLTGTEMSNLESLLLYF